MHIHLRKFILSVWKMAAILSQPQCVNLEPCYTCAYRAIFTCINVVPGMTIKLCINHVFYLNVQYMYPPGL